MNISSNKKLLTLLVVLLLLANVATLIFFWLGKKNSLPQFNNGPANFIIKELALNQKQQEQYLVLVNEHRMAVKPVREEIREEKDKFFSLLSNQKITEKEKEVAAKKVSTYTEKLDIITLNHFAAVRAICNPNQQQKFDSIIKQIIQMMRQQNPNDIRNNQNQQYNMPPHKENEGGLPTTPPQN